jgi:hypothetical protein
MNTAANPLRLPSRYEDLDIAFRGRLKANQDLLSLVKTSYASMQLSGGIRFLPIYGESGGGKSSAALELGTHLPETHVFQLPRSSIESPSELAGVVAAERKKIEHTGKHLLVAVVDQYEEAAAQKTAVPTSFVEALALLDRGDLRNTRVLFLWLTTSKDFQKALADATTRNRRILVKDDFVLSGPSRTEWPDIVEETFRFHNDKDLSDFEIIRDDLEQISRETDTIGTTIEQIGLRLATHVHTLNDLSTYQVIMLWPVTDGQRITRVQQFTDARQGYKLDWNAWYRQLNDDDRRQLPLRELNRARLYFDLRLVPIAAADLHPLCKDLNDDEFVLHKSYLDRFRSTHLYSLVNGTWDASSYKPLRERESERADAARTWYEGVTSSPTSVGKRLAKIFRELGLSADYEQTLNSTHGKIRADVLVVRNGNGPQNAIIEMKVFSAANTMPSSICEQVRITLRRHAQFAGFLGRQ